MASSNDKSFLLKILTGPHQGGEVVINPGTYTVGSDEGCDLVLSDALIQPRHLRFRSDGKKIALERLAEPVYIGGEPMAQSKAEVKAFDYITIGSTYFAFGPNHATWPENILLRLPPLKEPARAAASVPKVAKGKAGRNRSGRPPLSPRQRMRRLVALAATLMFFALAGFFAFVYEGPPVVIEKPLTIQQVYADIRKRVATIPSAQNLHVTLEGEEVIISGTVPTQNQVVQLYRTLAPYLRRAHIRVVAQETLALDVSAILQSHGLPLTTHTLPDGRIEISGYAGPDIEWQQVRSTIEMDIVDEPGTQLVFKVLTGHEAIAEAMPLLQANGLGSSIRLTPDNKGIIATGTIDPVDTAIWHDTRNSIEAKWSVPMQLEDKVKIRAMNSPRLAGQYEVDSMVVGPLPWITLRNGERYFIGANLPAGWMLATINPDYIEITRGTETRRVRLGESIAKGEL